MKPTKPSEYLEHHIYVSACMKKVYVALEGGSGWLVTEDCVTPIDEIRAIFPTYYWRDHVSLKLIQAVYDVLDEYCTLPENVTRIMF